MFPRPFHLVRRLDDPVTNGTITVDEYYAGNRIVSVLGPRCVITDFDAQQVTEIDHSAHSYSVTRFDEIAKSKSNRLGASTNSAVAHRSAADDWQGSALGMKSSPGGRAMDAYVLERPHEKIEIGVDRELMLSRDAIQAVIGAAYPNPPREEHDAIIHAAAGLHGALHATAASTQATSAQPSLYAVPIDQTITYDDGSGKKTSVHQTVLQVSYDTPPAAALEIDAGARLVESHAARMNRETDELLHPAVRSPEKP